jgi:acyl carrier protein
MITILPEAYKNLGSIEDIAKRIVGDHFGIPGAILTLETHIANDLGADEIDRLELIMTVEELFEIRIPEVKLPTIVQIRDIVNVLKEMLPGV